MAYAASRKPLAAGEKGGTFHPIVRVAAGVSRDRAQAEIDGATLTVAASLGQREVALPYLNDVRTILYPVGRPIMRLLLAATLFILLLGCANLANMMMVRGRRSLHETAVRLALGASRRDIYLLVLRRGFELVAIGAAVGLAGATALGRLLGSQLYETTPGDPVTLLVAAGLLIAAAVAAHVVPLRRATGIEPNLALRNE